MVAQQIKDTIPAPHQDVFHDGVFQGIVIAEQVSPSQALPQLERYSCMIDQPFDNGLRIGLWRYFKKDLLQGIAVANAYPERHYHAIFEELGWLLGSDYSTDLLKSGQNGRHGFQWTANLPLPMDWHVDWSDEVPNRKAGNRFFSSGNKGN